MQCGSNISPNKLGEIVLDPVIAFGQVLRKVRKETGLTQEQLGFAANIERNFVSLIELGRNQPTVRVIFRLAEALGTTPSALLAETEELLQTQVVSRNGHK